MATLAFCSAAKFYKAAHSACESAISGACVNCGTEYEFQSSACVNCGCAILGTCANNGRAISGSCVDCESAISGDPC